MHPHWDCKQEKEGRIWFVVSNAKQDITLKRGGSNLHLVLMGIIQRMSGMNFFPNSQSGLAAVVSECFTNWCCCAGFFGEGLEI